MGAGWLSWRQKCNSQAPPVCAERASLVDISAEKKISAALDELGYFDLLLLWIMASNVSRIRSSILVLLRRSLCLV